MRKTMATSTQAMRCDDAIGLVMTDDLQTFYSSRPEAERLLRGIGQLEAVRTRELLTEILPPSPAVVYDVGGGTGYYAAWLAAQGHTVHLLDPVAAHVEY